ncbi:hypothetical protein CALCODRAFT_116011 [Calocera cornea HHB12733]|uniref:Uncharacterized protein n=1 Tax=Calocera cornea HHB12733 TaxID=1353952 RepID=A0A165IBW9_9BASI|nr:hypothetical protein CALCODRAFT_116011 [Calocera cornea HHB12733]
MRVSAACPMRERPAQERLGSESSPLRGQHRRTSTPSEDTVRSRQAGPMYCCTWRGRGRSAFMVHFGAGQGPVRPDYCTLCMRTVLYCTALYCMRPSRGNRGRGTPLSAFSAQSICICTHSVCRRDPLQNVSEHSGASLPSTSATGTSCSAASSGDGPGRHCRNLKGLWASRTNLTPGHCRGGPDPAHCHWGTRHDTTCGSTTRSRPELGTGERYCTVQAGCGRGRGCGCGCASPCEKPGSRLWSGALGGRAHPVACRVQGDGRCGQECFGGRRKEEGGA